MAAAAARLSGVENVHVQTNVHTNGCSGLKKRTGQDENIVGWTDWSFYLRLRRMQSDNHLLLPCVFSIICYPLIPSILKTQLSRVEQQNKDRTAHHGASVQLYSNPSCAIIVTHLPIAREFQKVVWTRSMRIRCALNSIPPDVHSDAHYSVNTPYVCVCMMCVGVSVYACVCLFDVCVSSI